MKLTFFRALKELFCEENDKEYLPVLNTSSTPVENQNRLVVKLTRYSW
jgi:hypothetical protein